MKSIFENKSFNIQVIFVTLCSLLPLIDSINGIFSGQGGVGSIYKVLLLSVLGLGILLYGVNLDKFKTKVIAFLIIYIIVDVLWNFKIFDDSIISSSFPIKLVFNILLFYLLYEAVKNKVLSKQSLFIILNNSSWVFLICFLSPYLLGLGNTIYASGMGYKAFFISQNELSFVLLVLCLFTSYQIYLKISVIRIIQLLLLVMCGFLINTKSTIFGCLLSISILVFERIKKSDLKIKLITLAIVFVFALLFKNLLFSSISSVIARFTSLRSNYYEGSVLTAILSGRNLYIQEAGRYLLREHFAFRLIFGNGFCTQYLIEMDFIDMFFFMGLIGEIIFIYFIYRLGKVVYTMKKYDRSLIRFYYFCIVLVFMFITGHVIFTAMSGTYFVMFCCFLITYDIYRDDIECIQSQIN